MFIAKKKHDFVIKIMIYIYNFYYLFYYIIIINQCGSFNSNARMALLLAIHTKKQK